MKAKKQTPSVRVPEKTYIKLLKLRTKRRAKGVRVSLGDLIAEAVEEYINARIAR